MSGRFDPGAFAVVEAHERPKHLRPTDDASVEHSSSPRRLGEVPDRPGRPPPDDRSPLRPRPNPAAIFTAP